MSNIWFTSDTHFGHDEIIFLANRPFTSVEEMNETMIERWNARVQRGDLVYHLGDFAVKQTREQTKAVLERLNGQIYLIEGNHEDNALSMKHYFAHITPYRKLDVYGQKIVLFHYPIRSWDGIFKGSWHLFGHVHGLLAPKGKSLEVGVDLHSFNPLSFEEVKAIMETKVLETEESGFLGYKTLTERFEGK